MFRLTHKLIFNDKASLRCRSTQNIQNYIKDNTLTDQLQNEEIKPFETGWENAKPYSAIPGPNLFQLIRRFLPGGKYYKLDMNSANRKIREEYGNIAKLPGMLGRKPIVLLFDANDFETTFRTEGTWPTRRGIATFDHYRRDIRPDIFKNMGGLISENGQSWYETRTKANPIMLKPRTVNAYIPAVDAIAIEFISQIRTMRDNDLELPANFSYELNKWSLESIAMIALDERLNVLGGADNDKAKLLIKSVHDFFKLSYELDIIPSIWLYYGTPKYKKLMKCFDDLTESTLYYVSKAMTNLENRSSKTADDKEPGVLEKLLKIDKHVAMIMALDMLLAGVDTTSSAVANCLYHLAVNGEKQEKLRQEVRRILPDLNGHLTPESFLSAPYLRACIKEAMRITPITIGNTRGAGRDIVIKGYQIPKGTDLVMTHTLLQNDDKYFAESEKFLPERWFKESSTNDCPVNNKSANPFVYLPFGFGVRSCIGKRFAEMEIMILLTRLIHEFNVEWHYGPMKYKTSFILSPAVDLKFKLIDAK